MKLRRFCCLILLFAASYAGAVEQNSAASEDSDLKRWFQTDREDLAAPEEDGFQLPDLAQLKDWHVYSIGRDMGKNRVEIAADSVMVGKKDDILRYAIAIVSPSGVRNVLFEGLDCNTSRYRTYAFGLPDQSWKKIDRTVWKVGQLNTRNVWQGQLLKDFCDNAGPYKADVIMKDVRKGDVVAKPKN